MVVDVSAGAGAVDIDASHSGDEEDQEVAEAELQGLQKSSKVDESGNEEEVGQEWAAAAAELAGLADVAVQFEVLIPVSQLGQGERTAAAVARVAERVAAAQAQQAASSAAAVADAELAASGSSLVRYSRVALGDRNSRTDPFSGLFLGSFGPHGPELLQLQRGVWDGEEAVLATKLTGDVNVPAGVMSFRAKVGRKHKLSARDVYPEELGAIARYKGEGKVAQKGYSQPAWVDGELLVFGPGGSQLTGGAELGFVWIVPGERRYLILLSKLDLSSTAFSQ
ncbi:DUF3506 domain-containing protein [Haematococcus lacustris]|uniref:DUF3506 domain-containing protein n=1 Tax=Haematococcus lacustris TaxID=44745 RepID=A0A699Y9X7_HAELA|nr:DUF3506 domain-containing protein [Haematococcus lacustris]